MATEQLKYSYPQLRCALSVKYIPDFKDLVLHSKMSVKYFTNIALLLHIKITSTDIQLTILIKLILPVSFVAQISIG